MGLREYRGSLIDVVRRLATPVPAGSVAPRDEPREAREEGVVRSELATEPFVSQSYVVVTDPAKATIIPAT